MKPVLQAVLITLAITLTAFALSRLVSPEAPVKAATPRPARRVTALPASSPLPAVPPKKSAPIPAKAGAPATAKPEVPPEAVPTTPVEVVSGKFTVVNLKPVHGGLAALLQAYARKARASGLKPVVEFYADRFGPCRALRASFNDPMMMDALAGTYIIQLEAEAWGGQLLGTGFSVSVIPVFFVIDNDGRPTGRAIDGDAWGENIPSHMAPPLKAFFQSLR